MGPSCTFAQNSMPVAVGTRVFTLRFPSPATCSRQWELWGSAFPVSPLCPLGASGTLRPLATQEQEAWESLLAWLPLTQWLSASSWPSAGFSRLSDGSHPFSQTRSRAGKTAPCLAQYRVLIAEKDKQASLVDGRSAHHTAASEGPKSQLLGTLGPVGPRWTWYQRGAGAVSSSYKAADTVCLVCTVF